ncbi:MAG: hypothetical protein D6696_00895 [Acidobacteria bacterium]|nr:MAG: hypothetical protein D6696_00895 [Acidobacteriota bacterium]
MDDLEVIAYAGQRGDEEPRWVVMAGERRRVAAVRRRWRQPEGDFFDLELEGGGRLVLRCAAGDWAVVRGPQRLRPAAAPPAPRRAR